MNFKSSAQPRVRVPGRRHLIVALAVGAVLALGSAACGSGDGESSPAAAGKQPGQEAAPFIRLDPDQFAAEMGKEEPRLINVHIPYEGELEGTDAFVPFDRVVGDPALPADKASEVLLYCKSGRMSETAGEALKQAGYTNVAHLEGGMQAWEAAGKGLLHKTQESEPTGDAH